MKTVPTELIEEVWERQCALAQQPALALMRRFIDEQPALGVYLAAHNEQLGGEGDGSRLIPLVATVWESMTRVGGRQLKMVQPKVLDDADRANLRMLEALEDSSEFEWHDGVQGMFNGYNQRPLLAFCIEVLMAGEEETPELAPDRIGMELIWLKTVIDCFDKSAA